MKDYLDAKTEQAKYKEMIGIAEEQFMEMDEEEFRARFRERCHHTLEIQLFSSIHKGDKLKSSQADYVKKLMGIWKEKGLSTDHSEYVYAKTLIELAEFSSNGKEIDLSKFAPAEVNESMKKEFFNTIYQRRSVRKFKDKEVEVEKINKILEAGIWAAHACNLQSIRYLIIREENEPGLFIGSDVPGGPVHLVICQDMRCYLANPIMPPRNQLLDAGAAMENMALATHAVGLEGVWLTFTEDISNRLKKRFNLPEAIIPITYLDIGYGDQTPMPPRRWSVEDSVLERV